MASCRLDVLKDRAHDRRLSVGDAVDVKLDRVREELVDQYGAPFRYLHRRFNIFAQTFLVIDDRHAASAKDERRAHKHGIAYFAGNLQSVIHGVRDSARGLLHADLRD